LRLIAILVVALMRSTETRLSWPTSSGKSWHTWSDRGGEGGREG
jgi:hypothetical protein